MRHALTVPAALRPASSVGRAGRGRRAARLRGALAAAVAVALTAAGGALAAPGDLDTSFSGDGKWTLDFGGQETVAYDVLAQPDGTFVVVGAAAGDLAAYTLRADGSDTIDEAFVDFGGNDSARAVARQADGKLVLVGATASGIDRDIVVVRLTADLQRDPTFDGDGTKVIDLLGSDGAEDVLIQPDGKIVVVGDGNPDGDFAIVRLNGDGSFDSTFDGDGIVGVHVGQSDTGTSVAIQADGKLVIAGATGTTTRSVWLLRLDASGALDSDFDADGKLALTSVSSSGAVLIQGDGKIVLLATDGPGSVASLVRLTPDGSPDPGFASDGSLELDLGTITYAADLALRADGKLVAALTESSGGGIRDHALAMVTPSGSLDLSFDFDGKKTIDVVGGDTANAVALQADGRIVIAGDSGSPRRMSVVRVLADPPVAPSPPAPPPAPPAPAPPAAPASPPAPSGPTCNGLAATIVGTKGDDRLKGTPGPDVILGLGGSDVIDAKGGDDVVCGGAGPDVVKGGNGADVLLGQAGADDLRGGAGADQLLGGAGVDALRGGGGEDACTGGAGSDSGLGCESGRL